MSVPKLNERLNDFDEYNLKKLKLTWRMRVSFETWIKDLEGVWRERCSSFSFLRGFDTHEVCERTFTHFEPAVEMKLS